MKIKNILYISLSICTQVFAQSFGCLDLIRRFGPNSPITRIPLFFKDSDKKTNEKNKHNRMYAKRTQRKRNNKEKKLLTAQANNNAKKLDV